MAEKFLAELRRLNSECNATKLPYAECHSECRILLVRHADRIVALVEAVDEMIEWHGGAAQWSLANRMNSPPQRLLSARESLDEEQ